MGSITDFLQNWDSYIAGIGVLILSVVLWLFYQKKRKGLSLNVESISSLVDTSKLTSDDIQIFYKSNRLAYLELWSIRIINSGNIELVADDVKIPLSFYVEKDTLVHFELKDDRNLFLELDGSIKNGEVLETNFKLLNPGDSFIIHIFLSKTQNLKIAYKIAGLKRLTRRKTPNNVPAIVFGILTGIIILLMILFPKKDLTYLLFFCGPVFLVHLLRAMRVIPLFDENMLNFRVTKHEGELMLKNKSNEDSENERTV